jgi:hypothetical protein
MQRNSEMSDYCNLKFKRLHQLEIPLVIMSLLHFRMPDFCLESSTDMHPKDSVVSCLDKRVTWFSFALNQISFPFSMLLHASYAAFPLVNVEMQPVVQRQNTSSLTKM